MIHTRKTHSPFIGRLIYFTISPLFFFSPLTSVYCTTLFLTTNSATATINPLRRLFTIIHLVFYNLYTIVIFLLVCAPISRKFIQSVAMDTELFMINRDINNICYLMLCTYRKKNRITGEIERKIKVKRGREI